MKQVEAGWDSMRAGQLLHDVCLVEPHLLSDVITFVALFTKWRGRCKQARLSAATVTFAEVLFSGLLMAWIITQSTNTLNSIKFISSLLFTGRVWEHRRCVFILMPRGT